MPAKRSGHWIATAQAKSPPADFVGHTVRVKIGVEKKRGYAPRNIIEDYAASEARVVSLREVAS